VFAGDYTYPAFQPLLFCKKQPITQRDDLGVSNLAVLSLANARQELVRLSATKQRIDHGHAHASR